jgi:hypothetical protein
MEKILINGDGRVENVWFDVHCPPLSTGFDLRTVYEHFPVSYRLPDVKTFYEQNYKLTERQLVYMQQMMLFGRHEQWLNAMAHVLNTGAVIGRFFTYFFRTGQGVVLERSVFSDFVFVNAMRKKNLITEQCVFFVKNLEQVIVFQFSGIITSFADRSLAHVDSGRTWSSIWTRLSINVWITLKSVMW